MEPYPDFFIEAATLRGVYDTSFEDAMAIAELLREVGAQTVLDLPCGFGRIAGPLHELGFHVTGVDASADQIGAARARNGGPTYLVGSMLEPPAGPFDAILNLYTSFGYMASEDDDQCCLERWRAALRPGGILILETLDTERVAMIDDSERHLMREDGVFVRHTGPLTEYIATDPATRIMSIEYHLRDQVFTSRTRLYPRRDLVSRLFAAGFATVEVFSSFQKTPPFEGSPLVFIARR
jgi:SAM-dependent methyltransferase